MIKAPIVMTGSSSFLPHSPVMIRLHTPLYLGEKEPKCPPTMNFGFGKVEHMEQAQDQSILSIPKRINSS
ncbi:hypothetical protein GOP56_00255 [Brevibacillus sp. 7WMA2]|nr:hypothetical protein GOP56_00255 [Brevibacillus sp. 7WMA2]